MKHKYISTTIVTIIKQLRHGDLLSINVSIISNNPTSMMTSMVGIATIYASSLMATTEKTVLRCSFQMTLHLVNKEESLYLKKTTFNNADVTLVMTLNSIDCTQYSILGNSEIYMEM